MKLEDQVVSLELAKKLKELGVRQERATFYWCDHGGDEIIPKLYFIMEIEKYNALQGYAAFTVAELGAMLPPLCEIKRTREDNWRLEYLSPLRIVDGREHFDRINIRAETEANSRAKMLIYLLENNLIKKETDPDGE